ncbi:hypothetical protein [Streptomyces nigrescens]
MYEQLWLPMQQQLGPKNLGLLVWLDLVVRGESKTKQTDTYRVQQQRLEPLAGNEQALEMEIGELARRAELLRRILDPALEPHDELRQQLRHLARWGGRIHYPIALHLLDLVDAGRPQADEAARALGYVEGFLVRRMLCQASTQSLNRHFMWCWRAVLRRSSESCPGSSSRSWRTNHRTSRGKSPSDRTQLTNM